MISEIKKASPIQRCDRRFSPSGATIAYEDAGQRTASRLTEEHYFKGGSKYFGYQSQGRYPNVKKKIYFDEYRFMKQSLRADATF